MDREQRITDLLTRRYHEAAHTHYQAAREMVEFMKEIDSLEGHIGLAYIRPPVHKSQRAQELSEAVHKTHGEMMNRKLELQDWERFGIPPVNLGDV